MTHFPRLEVTLAHYRRPTWRWQASTGSEFDDLTSSSVIVAELDPMKPFDRAPCYILVELLEIVSLGAHVKLRSPFHGSNSDLIGKKRKLRSAGSAVLASSDP